MRLACVGMAALATVVVGASAQYLMMPDSTNNRLVLFDPFDGSVVNSNYFALQGGTPIHAMQVGNQIGSPSRSAIASRDGTSSPARTSATSPADSTTSVGWASSTTPST